MAHHGVSFDSYRGEAVPGTPVAFCMAYGLFKSATFSLRLYGDGDGRILTNAWVRRILALFDIWVQAGSLLAFRFTDEHLVGIVEEPTVAELSTSESSAQRFGQIRRLVPK